MSKKNKKPVIAIQSLTCCEGCQVSIFDLGERFLEFLTKVDIGDFRLIESLPDVEEYDIAIIEGTAITKEQKKRLKETRKKSKFLIAIGACACLGGVQELKNYRNKKEIIRGVYPNIRGIDNPDIKSVKEMVKVDLEIPGCPINKEEFFRIINETLDKNQVPKIPQKPVCEECPRKNNNCLLLLGKPCLGPISLAGCGAPCPSNEFFCDGCRGPRENINLDAMKRALKIKCRMEDKEIEMLLERFGKRNEMYKKIKRK
ncbi:MAG: NADH:ubiquinone oxidoreductase [Candidatus Portnoybacteria bacterium]|nr:NADH:ubiquinone oxidoreductase [Candidatus Portnoybacteria bacterium]